MPSLPQELIRLKREGEHLSDAQVSEFVQGITQGSWSEGQVAAMAMAICCIWRMSIATASFW